MKKLTVVILAYLCLSGVPVRLVAQLNETAKTQIGAGELKKIGREAKTTEQFRTLAHYYRQKELAFSARAAEQKIEWERRSQNVTGPNAKAPRPVDSARNLYEYYQYEADHAAKLADRYEDNIDENAARM